MKCFTLVFLFALSAPILSVKAFADAVEYPENLYFMEIPSVIGVSKTEMDLRYVPMSTYVISREEIKDWGVTNSILDLVGRVPGVTFYGTDFYGNALCMIRGFSGTNRIGVTLEDMPNGDSGQMVYAPNFYKNIEVSRGPGGLAWGAGASAGLINLKLRDDLEGGELSYELGSYGRKVIEYMYGHKFYDSGPNNHIFIGVQTSEQDPNIRKNFNGVTGAVWNENGFYGQKLIDAEVIYKNFKSILQYSYSRHDQPSPGAADVALADKSDINRRASDGCRYITMYNEYKLPVENVDLALYHHYSESQWIYDPVFIGGEETTELGFKVKKSLHNDRLNINAGGVLDGRNTGNGNYFSAVAVTNGIDWYNGNYSSLLQSRNNYSRNVYTELTYAVNDSWKVLAGGRYDYQDYTGTELAQKYDQGYFMKRFGLFYDLSENATLKYYYNNALRVPQGGEAWGVNGLVNPEDNQSHEVALVSKLGEKVILNVNVYNEETGNYIQNVAALTGIPGQGYANSGKVTSRGIECEFKYQPVKALHIYWNNAYCDAKSDDGLATLSQPRINSFLGAGIAYGLVLLNLDIRSYLGVPYIDQTTLTRQTVSNSFFDITLRTKKFYKNSLEVSLNVSNLFDSADGMPKFGEHAGYGTGLMPTESRRVNVKTSLYF